MKNWGIFFTLLLVLFSLSLNAESTDTTRSKSSKFDFGLEGMISMSVGKDFYSLNVGGPGFFFVLNKD